MSFSGVALTRVQRLAPELEVVLLIEGKVSWQVTRGDAAARLDRRPGDRGAARAAPAGPRLQRGGHRIHVWTVNTEDDLELCLDLGVGGRDHRPPGPHPQLLEVREGVFEGVSVSGLTARLRQV